MNNSDVRLFRILGASSLTLILNEIHETWKLYFQKFKGDTFILFLGS